MRILSFALLRSRSVLLMGGLLLALSARPAPAHAQGPPPDGPLTYQAFYDSLSPYGQWVTDPDYGYAWVPTAGPDFQPYRTNGHWVYTDYGWTWVSDYKWGWAAFHYGRWRYSDAYGWLWVPGYTWGPAWVAWRQSAGYYGWAPLGPPPVRNGVHVSIGFSFSFGDAPVAPARWCFVPAAYVASPVIATYYVPPAQTTVVYNNTTVIHNTYVNNTTNVNNTTVINNQNQPAGNPRGRGGAPGQPAFPAGPARADVEKATGQSITPLAVGSRTTPGVGVQGKSLAFYRPDVAAPNTPAAQRTASLASPVAPAPQKVVPLAQAATLARRPPPDPSRALLRDNAAQHLNSTDTDPVRSAQQRQAAHPASNRPDQPTLGAGQASATPSATPSGQPNQGTNAASPNSMPPATAAKPHHDQSATGAFGSNAIQSSPDQPATTLSDQNQNKAQRDQARQQQAQQQQQAKQQQEQAHQQQQQAKQQQEQARQQQQQAKQQQQAQQQARQQQQQARQAQQQARQQQRQSAPRPAPHAAERDERRR